MDQPPSRITRRQTLKRFGGSLLVAGSLSKSALAVTPSKNRPETFQGRLSTPPSPEGTLVRPTPLSPSQGGIPRSDHTATLLSDGRLLIAGGRSANRPLAGVEIFDPLSGSRESAADLRVPRYAHAALALPDGRVMVIGGYNSAPLSGVEIYDPRVNRWESVGSLKTPRAGLTATLLPGGLILVVGGADSQPLSSQEIYDPMGDRWHYL